MTISPDIWSQFSVYLFIDRKLDTSKGSAQSLKSRFNVLCKSFEGKEFNRATFNEFLYTKQLEGSKPAHLNNYIKMAKHIGRFFKTEQFEDITYFKEKKELFEVLTYEEMRDIAEVYIPYERNKEEQRARYKALFYLLACSGMRIMEALDLEFKAIFDEYILIQESKNGEQRYVPLPPFLLHMLRSLPKISDRVFNIRDKTLVANDLKRRALAIGCKKKVWNHLFRYSFITLNLEREMDPLILGKIVGHKSPQSTLRYDQRNITSMRRALFAHNPFYQRYQTENELHLLIEKLINNLYDRTQFNVNISVVKLTLPQ